MVVNLRSMVYDRPIKTVVKMVIDGEKYAVVAVINDSLLAVRIGDEITDGKAPLYYIWNVISKNANEWQVERATNGTALGFVEVD